MMGYGYGYEGLGMMSGLGVIGAVIGVVVLFDLVLVGIWLWQNISKK